MKRIFIIPWMIISGAAFAMAPAPVDNPALFQQDVKIDNNEYTIERNGKLVTSDSEETLVEEGEGYEDDTPLEEEVNSEEDQEVVSYDGREDPLAGLTQDYTSMPSAFDINAYIDDATSSPTDKTTCNGTRQVTQGLVENIKTDGSTVSPAAFGARKVLATMFQSCKPLSVAIDKNTPNAKGIRKVGSKRVLSNPGAYAKSNPFLAPLDKDPNYPPQGCYDATKTPPVYGYGSRKYPNSHGLVNLKSKGSGVSSKSRPVAGIDCSAFVSMSLACQGLKLKTTDSKFTDMTTLSYDNTIDRKNSCVNSIKFARGDTLRSGDIINFSKSHIIMVDEVGEDPLGIEKHLKSKTCSRISIRDFDFIYSHSGAISNSMGPSRVHISKHNGGAMFNNLVLTARKMCTQLARNAKYSGSVKRLVPNSRFSLTRHDSKNPNCISDKPLKLMHEECVAKCLQTDAIY